MTPDLPLQPSRDRRRARAARGRQKHGELVATDTRHEIGPSQTGSQQFPNLYQYPIAARMTMKIVNGLEIIQVDQQQRNRVRGACHPRKRRIDRLPETAAVRQAGQVVGK